ncbi:MAG: cyclophilin-like fold protein [Spirochaetes bacterium]|nr:cyclophilin-like fold protein [Spirochaetota bacterium]
MEVCRKKMPSLIMTFIIFWALTACNSTDRNTLQIGEMPQEQNVLIAYLSHTGNTRMVAEHIQSLTGGELFEIRTVEPYPQNYNNHLRRASDELAADYRPELSSHVSGMERYNVIFIGFPIWHGNTPMPIRTFLETYDFSGKTIIPFSTSGSSGISQSMGAIRNLLPNSLVLDGIGITRATLGRSYELIEEWLIGLGVNTNEIQNNTEENIMHIQVGDTLLEATLADNSSAEALKGLLTSGPITIYMRDYGNFEKVGSLRVRLPENNEMITTEPGDLILFQGTAFVIYYAPNTWNFTRLGRINNVTQAELIEILGEGNVTVTLSLPR